eukprot:scaffold6795_cov110-Cylindrotheca_fusiformis.AAC.8
MQTKRIVVATDERILSDPHNQSTQEGSRNEDEKVYESLQGATDRNFLLCPVIARFENFNDPQRNTSSATSVCCAGKVSKNDNN